MNEWALQTQVAWYREDYAAAMAWWHEAVEQGNAKAQYRLGTCWWKGKGAATDHDEAVKWLLFGRSATTRAVMFSRWENILRQSRINSGKRQLLP